MIDFKATPDGGESFTFTAGSRDVLNWERLSKGKTFQQLMENMAMAELYKLAHLAAKRQQLFTGTLQEFEETVELDIAGAEDVDPTQPGAMQGT